MVVFNLIEVSILRFNLIILRMLVEDSYECMLDVYLKVKFWEYVYEILNLIKEEIIVLDLIYMSYMDDKDQLFDCCVVMVKEYCEEMMEDDCL